MRSDPGLQPERTALSWRRSALAVILAGVVMLRLSLQALGWLGFIVGLCGVVGGVAAAMSGVRRYTRGGGADMEFRTPDAGLAAALLAASVVVSGLLLAVIALAGERFGDDPFGSLH